MPHALHQPNGDRRQWRADPGEAGKHKAGLDDGLRRRTSRDEAFRVSGAAVLNVRQHASRRHRDRRHVRAIHTMAYATAMISTASFQLQMIIARMMTAVTMQKPTMIGSIVAAALGISTRPITGKPRRTTGQPRKPRSADKKHRTAAARASATTTASQGV